jgi:hypothetical protein
MKYDIANRRRKKIEIWKELGMKFNLSFSKCLAVGNKLLGVDSKKQSLLVSTNNKDLSGCQVMDLEKIKSISVRKSYDSIKAGELTQRSLEEFLKYIHLRFEYSDKNITLFPLYERGKDNIIEATKMDLALKNVQFILSKLIGYANTKRKFDSSLK